MCCCLFFLKSGGLSLWRPPQCFWCWVFFRRGSALSAINWNVLMMLTGTMVIVELFVQSKMPLRMAEGLLKITPNVQWAIVALSLFSGLISAFVDNVATVLMVAPVGLAVARKIKAALRP